MHVYVCVYAIGDLREILIRKLTKMVENASLHAYITLYLFSIFKQAIFFVEHTADLLTTGAADPRVLYTFLPLMLLLCFVVAR